LHLLFSNEFKDEPLILDLPPVDIAVPTINSQAKQAKRKKNASKTTSVTAVALNSSLIDSDSSNSPTKEVQERKRAMVNLRRNERQQARSDAKYINYIKHYLQFVNLALLITKYDPKMNIYLILQAQNCKIF
jgi:hypothetical protein